MKQRLIQNAIAASGITGTVFTISMGFWWYTVSSDVVATVYILAAVMLTVLITTVREIYEAHEREFYGRLKRGICTHKVKIKYDSHGMHTDSQRLGYVSAETIREVCGR